MKWIIKSLAITFLLALVGACQAETPSHYEQRAEAKALIESLAKAGFPAEKARTLLADAKRQDSIIEAISTPAEGTLTWGQYRNIFLTESRIKGGVAFWKAHSDTLEKAEATYGVPVPVILAILGVETNYGNNMGSYRVLDALATLGFDYPPRADFFRKQLKQLFLLSQEANIDPAKVKGSYAGAMGMGQFIPSSYRHYAVDFNNDGITNLYQPVDAIGSIANYFAEHHWTRGLPVAAPATADSKIGSHFEADYHQPDTALARVQQLGIQAESCKDGSHPTDYCFDKLPDDTRITLLQLEGADGMEYWLTSDNFYTITRYNHSPLYAMAVFQLSREIQAAYQSKH